MDELNRGTYDKDISFQFVYSAALIKPCTGGIQLQKSKNLIMIVNLILSHLGFISGDYLLIAPFTDHCLPVPFYIGRYN